MNEVWLIHDDQEGPVARQSFLEMSGYSVRVLQSADELYGLLERGRPSVLVMDVLIHGRNGFELCRDLRAKYRAEELPIVLCSELYRARNFVEEAARVGAQHYLLKPFPLDRLADVVCELSSGARRRDAA